MKRILLTSAGILAIMHAFSQEQKPADKKDSFLLLEPVEVRAVRAGEKSQFTKTSFFVNGDSVNWE